MQGSFQRARAYGAGTRLWVIVFGIVGALFPAILILLSGVAVQLLIDPELKKTPTDLLLGPIFTSPALTSREISAEQKIAIVAGLAVFFSALSAICWTMLRRAARASARAAAAKLKDAIHAQAFDLGCNDVLGTGGSWPQELFTNKTEIVRQGLAAWWRAIPHAFVLASVLVAIALIVHPWLAVLGIVLSLMVWRVDHWLRDWSGHQSRLWNERAQLADERLVETLNLAPLATNYSLADPPSESFADVLRQHQSAGYRADAHEAARSPWFWMIVIWSVVFFMLVVAMSRQATFAGTVVLALALVGAFFPVRRLLRLSSALPSYELAAKEVFSYLERTPTIVAVPGAPPLAALQRELRIENVTLHDREGHQVLADVNLNVPHGSRVALLSMDEHTPRAMFGLLVRFYDPAGGRVLVDDCDLKSVNVDSVRKQASLVLHDALLFTGSVSQNISCGRPEFTADEIHDAAKEVQALDFIYQLPDGFETIVGEHGLNLEASRAFRIALARAIIRRPSLLIAEEPRGELSDEDSAAVDGALDAAAKGRTLLILPARLSTLRAADLIVLLHGGRIVATGKHADLLQASELYRHLNYMRFHKFPA